MSRLLVCVALLQAVDACLPGLMPYSYAPAYSGAYYSRPMMPPPAAVGGLPAMPAYTPYGPRIGPYRSEAQRDEVRSVSVLNCGNFEENCRWSNTNEEELDWHTVKNEPGSDRWLAALGTTTYPEPSAGAIISPARRGWDGAQLISDALPCLSQGVTLTATVWKSAARSSAEEPKLQICSRNMAESKFPLINCNEFEVRSGVPATVEVPVPNDPAAPAQIVIYANNFVAPEGAALFLQDIRLEGELECTGSRTDEHPTLINEGVANKMSAQVKQHVGPLKAIDGLNALEAIDAPSQFQQSSSALGRFDSGAAPPGGKSSANELAPSGLAGLFETCLALSCNPSDLSCKFWRSQGTNRWEIGTAGRVANPLTGIQLPPGTAQKFLVAPFTSGRVDAYTLVSEQLSVPPLQDVYFCFYEYYATHGLSLRVCTDRMDCFYKKDALLLGQGLEENKKWQVRCAKLPPGNYELRVIASNEGENKGEVGFLPIRLSRDPRGEHFIC